MGPEGQFCLIAFSSMSSHGLDDFIDDCFVEKDPICDLRRQDSLELDRYASALIAEMMLSSGTATS